MQAKMEQCMQKSSTVCESLDKKLYVAKAYTHCGSPIVICAKYYASKLPIYKPFLLLYFFPLLVPSWFLNSLCLLLSVCPVSISQADSQLEVCCYN